MNRPRETRERDSVWQKIARAAFLRVSKICDLPLFGVHELTQALFDELWRELLATGRVWIPGFGIFTVRSRKARVLKNPKTGKLMDLPLTWNVHFRASKDRAAELAASAHPSGLERARRGRA